MSTKTTFKRVALVAVAALGLGVLASVPSSATQAAAQSFIYCSKADGGDIANTTTTGATCGGVAGSSNFVTLTGVQTTKDVELTVTGGTFVSQTSGSTFLTNTTNTVALAAAAYANTTIKVATPVAGTITVSVKTATAGSGVFDASTETVVITVGATALSGVYSAAKSSVYLVAGETFTATADATTAPTKAKTYTGTDSATASIVVTHLDGLSKPVRNDTITATITSGPGTIWTGALITAGGVSYYDSRTASTAQASGSLNNYSSSAIADLQGKVAFYVFANNQAGTSVITLKNSAGTVIGTKSVTFTDTTIASIEATVVKAFVQGDTAGHTANAIKLVLKDDKGNVMTAPSSYPTVTSGATTIGTASQNGVSGNDTATAADGAVYWGVDAVGGVYGPVTYTFKAGTVTATATVTFSSATAATFSGSAANTTANGDVVYTFTAADAKGYAVPDDVLLSDYIASVTSVGTSGSLSTQAALTAKSVSGKWTTTAVSAPSSTTDITSTFVMTGTKGTASTKLPATLTGINLPVKFSVANPSIDAATDAANEATDAANAATDAALQAADDAAAASAAVAKLSKSVNKALKALKAQITALTKLVNRLL